MQGDTMDPSALGGSGRQEITGMTGTSTAASEPSGSSSALNPDMSQREGQSEASGSGQTGPRKSSFGADDKESRVQLACFYCRTKRIRCGGEKPICTACEKAGVVCEWPTGRRKKRTRKEMDEAKAQKGVPTQGDQQASEPGPSKPKPKPPQPSTQSQEAGPSVPPGGFTQTFTPDLGSGSIPQLGGSGFESTGGKGYDGLFGMDSNSSYSGDLATTSFDPSEFWNFPPSSSSSLPPPNIPTPTSIPVQSALPSNYVWPTGFTPEMTLPAYSGNTSLLDGIQEPTMAQFMSDTSPATDMRLINALENQAAYIEGNPEGGKDLELFYYRFAGSTAIQPGIHRISLKLQRRTGPGESALTSAPQPERSEDKSPPSMISIQPKPSELFDANGMPLLSVWLPYFENFLTYMSQHFPSVSRQRMSERFESGTMSAFLANCICACGARFSPEMKDRQAEASAPFIAKAQELIIPLVHLPTTETTSGLIFLAWANFGQNSESGLWQYSGMAIRMAIDIGIQENSDIYESPAHATRTRLLFWTLFVTDRIVAFATGRPASISEDIVEVPLPEDKDFFPDPARNTPGFPTEAVEPVPFVYFVKLMIICGRISNVLNGRRGRARTLTSTAEPLAEQLAELQTRLMQFVAGLPESLRWSANNFKHQHTRGHGGCFLAIHLWSHAVLALIYHPELLKSPSGVETPLNKSMSRNVKLSLISSRQICECMVFADLVAPSSYTSTPFLVQPLFVASMALIHEIRAVQVAEAHTNASDMFVISMARQNLTALLNAIATMEQYWAGAGYVATILEKRSGVKAATHSARKTLISLPDLGLLKRFSTDKDDPRDLAPATSTSMRESIAKSEKNNPSPYWLADLMAGYTVENMSFAPADSLDLERLLSGNLGVGGFGMGMGGESSQNQGLGDGLSGERE